MIKSGIITVLQLLLITNLSANSGNISLPKPVGTSSTRLLEATYNEGPVVNITSIEIIPLTSCEPPNGGAEVFEITKDGVVEDLTNFSITWYNEYNDVISTGPILSNVQEGRYFAYAVHKESGMESANHEAYIFNNTETPFYAALIESNTSCDPLNPNGQITIFVDNQSHPSEHDYTWFEGTMDDLGDMLFSYHDRAFELSAGFYTVIVTDNNTYCQAAQTYEVLDATTTPEINFNIKHNSHCISNGEIEITEVIESGEIKESSDYDFRLFNSNKEFLQKSEATLLTGLSGGTYYIEATNRSTLCASAMLEVTLNNDYDMSLPSLDFTVEGPNPEFSRCGAGSMTLSAKGDEHFRWYHSEVENDLLYEGSTYTIENLEASGSIWISAYDPDCDKESARKEILMEVVSLPLITSLTSNTELAVLTAQVNGLINWYIDDALIEGENEKTIVASKDGRYSIEVTNGECLDMSFVDFKGLSFSQLNNLITAPQIAGATYEWSFNGTILGNEASHELPVSKNGTYSVTIIRESEPETLDYAIEVDNFDVVMGIQHSFSKNNMNVYPIPFKNSITIDLLEDNGEQVTIRLLTMNGKLIINKTGRAEDKNITLDVPNLDKGIYFLEILHSKGSYFHKIVK